MKTEYMLKKAAVAYKSMHPEIDNDIVYIANPLRELEKDQDDNDFAQRLNSLAESMK